MMRLQVRRPAAVAPFKDKYTTCCFLLHRQFKSAVVGATLNARGIFDANKIHTRAILWSFAANKALSWRINVRAGVARPTGTVHAAALAPKMRVDTQKLLEAAEPLLACQLGVRSSYVICQLWQGFDQEAYLRPRLPIAPVSSS
jgi:hypothetical protein